MVRERERERDRQTGKVIRWMAPCVALRFYDKDDTDEHDDREMMCEHDDDGDEDDVARW